MNPLSKIAALQINGRALWSENQPVIERLVRDAAALGARVVVMPENLYAMTAAPRALLDMGFDPEDEPVVWLRDLARRHDVWLVAGTLPIRAANRATDLPAKLYSRCFVIDAAGEIRAQYDKIHLFDVTVPQFSEAHQESYRESDLFEAGSSPVVVDTPAGRLGLAICFDLRFPELFRRLVEMGATWVCLPAAFTEATGRAHWEPLLRARAIENQIYLVASAQVGRHASGRQTYGHSMIIDPWGQVLANANTVADCLITAEIDPQVQSHIRNQFPVLALRRLKG
jgi:nitrilase